LVTGHEAAELSGITSGVEGQDTRVIRRRPDATERRHSDAPTAPEGTDFYGPAVVGASTIGAAALAPDLLDEVLTDLAVLSTDAYLEYVAAFVADGRARAGAGWRYADITTVLAACATMLRPQSYLEIGVRRGRSMSVVAKRAPECHIVGIDLWEQGYAGIDNPGPEHVRAELARVGHQGNLELLSADSHVALPRLLAGADAPDFDLITVDGDHSDAGARQDLEHVLPRLRLGGAVVFDDISHPRHPGLRDVWRRAVADRRYATLEFDDVGYGVALAVRRW
jgi:predicted O-methyltransferase YrrM